MITTTPLRAIIVFGASVLAACSSAESEPGKPVVASGTAAPGFVPAGTSSAGVANPAANATGNVATGTGAATGTSGGATTNPLSLSRVGLAARLSKFEYQYSISDVLGVTLSPAELDAAAGGIPDDTGDGVLKHLADKQTSIEQHALAYSQVADAVAKRVDTTALLTRLKVCTEATTTCGTAFIKTAGQRLYRRPLDEREVTAMLGVYNAALTEKQVAADAARWTLRALLQAPQFLFRMEQETTGQAGQQRDLNAYELATRLASFIWVSVPDEALLALAANGTLTKTDVLDAQVTRMLADAKAQRLTEVFATDFSRARYASYDGSTDAERVALNESIVATFQNHFWTKHGSISDLFTTTEFVVNPTVAGFLGVSITGTALQKVDVSKLPQRVGLMSHPSVIAGMGDFATGSFVNRGKYLMERLLCRNAVAVPDALGEEINAFTADTTGLNEPERSAIRQTRAVCWGCHQQFEPLSFGFARFDGAGRYVGEKDAAGKPLPLNGWVPTGAAVPPPYTDVASYMKVLSSDATIQQCMTEHFIAFATSRSSDEPAKLQATSVGTEYQTKGSTLQAMVAAVTRSQLFRTILPVSSAANGAKP